MEQQVDLEEQEEELGLLLRLVGEVMELKRSELEQS